MHKSKLILSLLIFIILMIFTSAIKTQTRKIEKNIIKLEKEIVKIKNMLHESQIDFSYLSSPTYAVSYLFLYCAQNPFQTIIKI